MNTYYKVEEAVQLSYYLSKFQSIFSPCCRRQSKLEYEPGLNSDCSLFLKIEILGMNNATFS